MQTAHISARIARKTLTRDSDIFLFFILQLYHKVKDIPNVYLLLPDINERSSSDSCLLMPCHRARFCGGTAEMQIGAVSRTRVTVHRCDLPLETIRSCQSCKTVNRDYNSIMSERGHKAVAFYGRAFHSPE